MNPDQLYLTEQTLIRRYGKATAYKVMHSDYTDAQVVTGLATEDFQYFCQFFLPTYFKLPYGPMHNELAADVDAALQSNSGWKELLIWPRGFGKSSHVCTGLGVYTCALRKRPYMAIIKNSYQNQAEPEVAAIRDELQYNDTLKKYFGEFKGRTWGKGEIITAGRWPHGGVKVRGFGVGMRIRGTKHGPHRPGIVVMDDLETLESVESRDQRDKIRSWHDRDAMFAGFEPGEEDKCLYWDIGTKIHSDSLVANLQKRALWKHRFWQAELSPAKNMILWDEWKKVVCNLSDENRLEHGKRFFEEHKAGMLEGTEVSWPDGYDYYRLMLVRIGEQKVGESLVASYEAEMQNDPLAASERVFKVKHFYHFEDRDGELWIVPDSWGKAWRLKDGENYGACDPSLGETSSSDYSAIGIMNRSPWGQKAVIIADIERRSPDRTIDDIFKYCQGRELEAFGIEAVAFQKLMYSDTVKEAMERQNYVPFIPLPAPGKKTLRICSLVPDLSNGYILLNPEHILLNEQIDDYSTRGGMHDDGPDMLEMLNRVTDMAGGGGGVMF